MRKVGQVRFYGNGNKSNNYPDSLTSNELISGSVFGNITSKGRIVQLGIQTIPGVKFRLNKGLQWLVIGNTGIYDLELDGTSTIVSLSFSNDSMALLASQSGYLIVDYIYEEEEV